RMRPPRRPPGLLWRPGARFRCTLPCPLSQSLRMWRQRTSWSTFTTWSTTRQSLSPTRTSAFASASCHMATATTRRSRTPWSTPIPKT
ncbi:hypothetical protein IWW38_004075, partial [Coemansia aciculifera]